MRRRGQAAEELLPREQPAGDGLGARQCGHVDAIPGFASRAA